MLPILLASPLQLTVRSMQVAVDIQGLGLGVGVGHRASQRNSLVEGCFRFLPAALPQEPAAPECGEHQRAACGTAVPVPAARHSDQQGGSPSTVTQLQTGPGQQGYKVGSSSLIGSRAVEQGSQAGQCGRGVGVHQIGFCQCRVRLYLDQRRDEDPLSFAIASCRHSGPAGPRREPDISSLGPARSTQPG